MLFNAFYVLAGLNKIGSFSKDSPSALQNSWLKSQRLCLTNSQSTAMGLVHQGSEGRYTSLGSLNTCAPAFCAVWRVGTPCHGAHGAEARLQKNADRVEGLGELPAPDHRRPCWQSHFRGMSRLTPHHDFNLGVMNRKTPVAQWVLDGFSPCSFFPRGLWEVSLSEESPSAHLQ